MNHLPAISVVPIVPLRSRAGTQAIHRAAVEAFLATLPGLSTELAAFVAAMNVAIDQIEAESAEMDQVLATAQSVYELIAAASMPEHAGTSATAVSIGLGPKAVVASTGKIWWKGQTLYLRSSASAANFMVGVVDSYNPVTGNLTVVVFTVGGSGSPTNWLIYPAGPRDITTERPVYEAIGTFDTSTGIRWTIDPLPPVYADLHFEIVGMSHNANSGANASLQVETYDGTSWSAPIVVRNAAATTDALTHTMRLEGYNLKTANLAADTGSGLSRSISTTAGVKGIRFSWSGSAPGDAGEIRAWGR